VSTGTIIVDDAGRAVPTSILVKADQNIANALNGLRQHAFEPEPRLTLDFRLSPLRCTAEMHTLRLDDLISTLCDSIPVFPLFRFVGIA